MAIDGRQPWPSLNPMSDDEIYLEAVKRYGHRLPLSISKLQRLFQLGFHRASELSARLHRHRLH